MFSLNKCVLISLWSESAEGCLDMDKFSKV